MSELKKLCDRCERMLSLDKFYFLPSVNRHHNYCIECDKEYKRQYYITHKKEIDKKRKEWQENNYDLHLSHARKYRKTEKGKMAKKR